MELNRAVIGDVVSHTLFVLVGEGLLRGDLTVDLVKWVIEGVVESIAADDDCFSGDI